MPNADQRFINTKGTRRQQGLTLVELLIAMTLGLVVVAGMLQVFSSTKNGFRIQESLNIAQENGRFAMHFIEYDARMADHWGGVEAGEITVQADASKLSNATCNKDKWVFDVKYSVQGFDAANNAAGIDALVKTLKNCIKATNYQPETDVLVFRYAGATPAKVLVNGMPYVQVQPGNRGVLFVPSNNTNVNTLKSFPFGNVTSRSFPYTFHLYYIRSCSPSESATDCSKAVEKTPTLTRVAVTGNSATEEPLIEGVSNLQANFLVDTDADGYGDVCKYIDAAFVGADQQVLKDTGQCKFPDPKVGETAKVYDIGWNDVVAVNVTLIVESKRKLSWDKAHPEYNRRAFSKTIQIRNRSRS